MYTRSSWGRSKVRWLQSGFGESDLESPTPPPSCPTHAQWDVASDAHSFTTVLSDRRLGLLLNSIRRARLAAFYVSALYVCGFAGHGTRDTGIRDAHQGPAFLAPEVPRPHDEGPRAIQEAWRGNGGEMEKSGGKWMPMGGNGRAKTMARQKDGSGPQPGDHKTERTNMALSPGHLPGTMSSHDNPWHYPSLRMGNNHGKNARHP